MTIKEARSYSDSQLRRLASDAKYRDDAKAMKKLEEINQVLAKESNKRLAQLEKAGYKQYAYDLAVSYTKTAYETDRFKGEDFTDPNDIRRQIAQMQTFLEKRTSFVVGQKEVEKLRLDKFEARFAKIYPGQKISRRKLNKFLQFLGDRTVRDFIAENTYESGERLDMLFGKYMNSKLDDIKEQFENWNKTEHGIQDGKLLDYAGLKRYLVSREKE